MMSVSPGPAWSAPPSRGRFALAVLAAVAGHTAIGVAWLIGTPAGYGNDGTILDAVSVELVDGRALEQARPVPADGTASVATPIAATLGDASVAVAESRAAPDRAPSTTPVIEAQPVTETATERAEPAIDMALLPALPPLPRSPPPSIAAIEQAATIAGGAVSRTAAAMDGAAPAAAGAPPGIVSAYGASVAQALQKTRPNGRGGTGDVRVAFTIAPDGSLARATVVTSSGDPRLETAALDAVRRASFRQPPAAMTEQQRTFEVPYRFR